MKDSFKNRLKIAMEENNMKAIDLSNKTDLSKALISGYLNGKYLARQDKLSILGKTLNVSEAWLMGYDVPKQRDLDGKPDSNVFPIPDKSIPIPIVGKISAGLPILAIENITGYAFMPSSRINPSKTYFYLVVQRR